MSKHSLPRWLGLAANAGVLIGIVLVIMELDQNRDMMRAQIRHELSMAIVGLLQEPAVNPQLADVLYRANASMDLSPTEQYQFEMRTNALFRYWEDVHYQYRVGLYDETEFARQREAWRQSLARSGRAVSYWCGVRSLYSPDFGTEMDGLLAQDACETGL